MDDRYVVVAWDRTTGESYVSVEMLDSPHNLISATSLLEGLAKTTGDSKAFFLVPYHQIRLFLETERQQREDGPRSENSRLIH